MDRMSSQRKNKHAIGIFYKVCSSAIQICCGIKASLALKYKLSGTLLAFLLCFLSQVGAQVPSTDDYQNLLSPEGRVVKEIDFEGVRVVSRKDLRKIIGFEQGEYLTQERLDNAIANLKKRNVFSEVSYQLQEVGGGIKILFLLKPSIKVIDVEFVGNEHLSIEALRRIAEVGRMMRGIGQEEEELVRKGVAKAYAEKGFYQVDIEFDLERRKASPEAVWIIMIKEGPRSVISKINILGEESGIHSGILEELNRRLLGTVADNEGPERVLRDLEDDWRKRGYQQARLFLADARSISEGNVQLDIRFTPGNLITIEILGNEEFSEGEIIDYWEEVNRERLGHFRSVRDLCSAVRRLYEENGYFLVVVSCVEDRKEENQSTYRVQIKEGPRYALKAINVAGAEKINETELRKVVQTLPEDWSWLPFTRHYLTTEKGAADLAAIKDYYWSKGYMDAVVDFDLDINHEEGQITVNLQITEGELSRIKGVTLDIQGDVPLEVEQDLRQILAQVSQGLAWDEARISAVGKEALLMLREKGYAGAEVRAFVTRETSEVEYKVVVGPKVKVGRVFCRGNVRTRDSVILSKIPLNNEDVWRQDLVESAAEKLYRLGIFRSVEIGPADGTFDSATEDLAITVEEREPAKVELGLLFDTNDGLKVKAEKVQRNWEGMGRFVSIGIDATMKRVDERLFDAGRAWGTLRVPVNNDDVLLVADSYALFAKERAEGYSFDRLGVSFGVRNVLSESSSVFGGLDEYYERVFDVPEDVSFGDRDSGTNYYGKLRLSWEFDNRDNPFIPHRGTRCQTESFLTEKVLGSNVQMYGMTMGCGQWIPLGKRFAFAINSEGGIARAFGDTEVVPLTERFFLGGRDTLRGFSPAAVGPRSFQGNIVGGDSYLVFNHEVYYSLSDTFSLIGFVDVGQAFLSEDSRFVSAPGSRTRWRASPGLGVRYLTPVGPLGLEYGVALDREYGERPGRFFMGIGGAF